MTDLVASCASICEPVSSLSHLAAALLAVAAAVPLVRSARGDRVHTAVLAIYATCVVTVLAVSGTYHSFPVGRVRTFMRHMDYLAIWLLVAGTLTAVHGVMFQGFWRRWFLMLVWLYTAGAIILQARFFEQLSGPLGLLLYFGLGWSGLSTVFKVGRIVGFRSARPLWVGGLVYSVGAVVEALHQPVIIPGLLGPHEIFHFVVIVGVLIHWRFIRRMVRFRSPAPSTRGLAEA